MGIGSSILNYFNEPAESNEFTYDFAKAMGEDTIEANRNPRLATIGQFIKKYSPDLPILGQVFGQGIGDYLINSGYNRTKGQVLKDTAFGMLDFADIAGTGFLLKQGLKKPMYNSDMDMFVNRYKENIPSTLRGQFSGSSVDISNNPLLITGSNKEMLKNLKVFTEK